MDAVFLLTPSIRTRNQKLGTQTDVRGIYNKPSDSTTTDIFAAGFCTAGYADCQAIVDKYSEDLNTRITDVKVLYRLPLCLSPLAVPAFSFGNQLLESSSLTMIIHSQLQAKYEAVETAIALLKTRATGLRTAITEAMDKSQASSSPLCPPPTPTPRTARPITPKKQIACPLYPAQGRGKQPPHCCRRGPWTDGDPEWPHNLCRSLSIPWSTKFGTLALVT